MAGKGRIRHPKTVSINGTNVADVASVQWDNNYEYNRDKADDQFSGDPVEMSRAGSGSIELLAAGSLPACYGQGMTVVYNQVTVESGTETVTEKTATFTKVTYNNGANVPAEGRGSRSIKFDYAECSIA